MSVVDKELLESKNQIVKTDTILLNEKVSLDRLVKNYKLDKDELIKLNGGFLPEIIQPGTRIILPTKGDVIELANLSTASDESSITKDTLDMLLSGTLISPNTEAENRAAQSISILANSVGTDEGPDINTIVDKQLSAIENNAKSAVQSAANEAANQLLGRFGTAQVNLSVDEHGKLTNTDLSVFSPIYDDKANHLLFAQNAVREQGNGEDSRIVGNFGLGYRYNTEDYLIGANTFIDHDFTGDNTRFGLGAELWTDYAKIAANFYSPISDWKNSDVLSGYDERPARGYDVRAQAYLPSYPQLGASLAFEQYFGDEVALFGKDERQRDPFAVTAGLDYTPVPLFTLGATHRMGEGSKSDTRLDVQMNLRMGMSIEEQLDPANVVSSRQLMGSRYDLVDRNNEIVFEYRKQKFDVAIIPTDYKNLPLQAEYEFELNDFVDIESLHNSPAPITQFTWTISPLIPQRYASIDSMSFKAITPGYYTIQLNLTNERGATAKSNVLLIKVGLSINTNQLKIDFVNRTDNHPPFDFNNNGEIDSDEADSMPNRAFIFNEFDAIPDLGSVPDELDNRFLHFTVTAEGENGQQITLDDLNMPTIFYMKNGEFIALDKGIRKPEELVLVKHYRDPEQPNKWHYIVATSEIDFFYDTKVSVGTVFYAQAFIDGALRESSREQKMIFAINSSEEMKESQQYRITLHNIGRDGNSAPELVLDTANNLSKAIKQDTYYQTTVFERSLFDIDGVTIPGDWVDITAQVQNSLVWRYYNPEDGDDISVQEQDGYYGLEACRGYTAFSTQTNNFVNNEMAWGKLGEEYINLELVEQKYREGVDILTEQNLLLAVQFDKSTRDTTNNQIDVSKVLCDDKIPASQTYYDLMVDISEMPVDKTNTTE